MHVRQTGSQWKNGTQCLNFMKKKPNTELMKDDEALREEAACDGPILVGGIELRPITALSLSWMQRNKVFSDEKDTIWKSAAFAFLHSEPFSKIRAVVNSPSDFIDAVDIWIESNMKHHAELLKFTSAMKEAFDRYTVSANTISESGQPKN